MSWQVKYQRHRRKCQHVPCGQMFQANKPTQRFCSNSCSIRARGPAWFAAHQAKITAIRLRNGYSRFVQRMRAAGLTDAQIGVVRRELLNARSASDQSGYRRGWADACGERKRA